MTHLKAFDELRRGVRKQGRTESAFAACRMTFLAIRHVYFFAVDNFLAGANKLFFCNRFTHPCCTRTILKPTGKSTFPTLGAISPNCATKASPAKPKLLFFEKSNPLEDECTPNTATGCGGVLG